MDGSGKVDRIRSRTPVHGRTELFGRGPRTRVRVQSGFEGSGQACRNAWNQEGQRGPFPDGFGNLAGEAKPTHRSK
jgi:hypothetical protein